MPKQPEESAQIKDTDIVFDCPNCGKSLAIDYRGAGLSIPCSDCGVSVEVPIPEGMELTDIDSSEEEQEMLILNLRKSLAAAETHIDSLSAEIEALTQRRGQLEKAHSSQTRHLQTVREQAATISANLAEIQQAWEKITRAIGEG